MDIVDSSNNTHRQVVAPLFLCAHRFSQHVLEACNLFYKVEGSLPRWRMSGTKGKSLPDFFLSNDTRVLLVVEGKVDFVADSLPWWSTCVFFVAPADNAMASSLHWLQAID